MIVANKDMFDWLFSEWVRKNNMNDRTMEITHYVRYRPQFEPPKHFWNINKYAKAMPERYRETHIVRKNYMDDLSQDAYMDYLDYCNDRVYQSHEELEEEFDRLMFAGIERWEENYKQWLLESKPEDESLIDFDEEYRAKHKNQEEPKQKKKEFIAPPLPSKKRLFVDMDGTLAEWRKISLHANEAEEATAEVMKEKLNTVLRQPEYFYNLKPHQNVVEAIKQITKKKDIEVYILSCYLPTVSSSNPKADKNRWLDKYLPEIDEKHRIFVPNGCDKTQYVPDGVTKGDYLLDDYTKNLNDWVRFGNGIKLLNDVNSTKNTWKGNRISYDGTPEDIANKVLCVMNNIAQIHDENPKKYWEPDDNDSYDEENDL